VFLAAYFVIVVTCDIKRMTTCVFADKIVVVFILQSIAERKVMETVARFITH